MRKVWWNLKWVPFTYNGGGDHPCIDLDPAVTGTVGQVVQSDDVVVGVPEISSVPTLEVTVPGGGDA